MRNNLIGGQVNTLQYNMSYNPQGESYEVELGLFNYPKNLI